MSEPSDTDWAYAAGIVDGEGCIAITRGYSNSKGKYTYSVAVVVTNRERDVLDWLHQLWQGWIVMRPSIGNFRPAWHWRSPTGTSVEAFLIGLRPWLRIKTRQCDNALAMIHVLKRSRYTLGRKLLPVEWLELQEKHYWIQRELNHRGTKAFVAQPMHSPRKIHRERAVWAEERFLSAPSSLEPEPVQLPPLGSYEACIEQALTRDLAFSDHSAVNEYHGDAEVIDPV